MKECFICKRELPFSEFNKDASKKDGYSTYCRECLKKKLEKTKDERNARRRERYKTNKNNIKDQNKRYREQHRDELLVKQRERYRANRERELAKRIDFKEQIYKKKTPCVKCGETRSWIIQFHHIDYREKKFEISKCAGRTIDSVLAEIDKCVCLCSNCHDEYHYFFGDNPIDPVGSLTEYLGRNPYEV